MSKQPQANYAWIQPYIKRVLAFLGCQAWTVRTEQESGLNHSRGSLTETVQATCTTSWPYLDATITVDAAVWIELMPQPSTQGKLLLCHECLHIALAGLSQAMQDIVNAYFPAEDGTPSDKTTAFTLYTNHEEHTIVRLSRQVYEALERDAELTRLRAEVKALKRQAQPPT